MKRFPFIGVACIGFFLGVVLLARFVFASFAASKNIIALTQHILTNPNCKVHFLTQVNQPQVDLMVNHGWAYASWEQARLEGRIKPGAILLHLDSHFDDADGDGIIGPPQTVAEAENIEYGIDTFIVPALTENFIEEIYFVKDRRWADVQGKMGLVPRIEKRWLLKIEDDYGVVAAKWATLQEKNTLYGYSPNQIKGYFFLTPWPVFSEGKIISIHGPFKVHCDVFVDQLPDFSQEQRSVILDIDEDFFFADELVARDAGNEEDALWTRKPPFNNPSQRKKYLCKVLRQTIQGLAAKNIKPGVITIPLSPGYAPVEHSASLTEKLIAALEQFAIVKFQRDTQGKRGIKMYVKPTTSIKALIRARKFFRKDDLTSALITAEGIIKEYTLKARQQQEQKKGESIFVGEGYLSPVVRLEQEELNAVAEAHYLKGLVFLKQGDRTAAAEEFHIIETEDNDGFVIASEYVRFPEPIWQERWQRAADFILEQRKLLGLMNE